MSPGSLRGQNLVSHGGPSRQDIQQPLGSGSGSFWTFLEGNAGVGRSGERRTMFPGENNFEIVPSTDDHQMLPYDFGKQ